jgi:predicted nuclease with RNAse H fold
LDDELQVVYLGFLGTDSDIVSVVDLYSPEVVAIDAPLSLSLGLSRLDEDLPCLISTKKKGRACERELAQLGIPCYFTTERSIIKKMVCRGIELKNRLCHGGSKVIEVYPYASKVRLFGKHIPRKTTPLGTAFLREHLKNMLPSLERHLTLLDHNLCDAAMAAYTASLYCRDNADAVGNEQEGLIFIPSFVVAQSSATSVVY